MASTFSGCVRFHASPQLPCSRPASINCVPMAPSPSSGRSLMASSSVFFMECVMNGFEHQAPLVFPAGGVAIAAGAGDGTPPREHVAQGLAEQRLLAADGVHQRIGIGYVLAHPGV